ncbi:uncharacterized protein LOC136078357 [Hydra vulgaris]|uniref:Uncharacterized protein LOC136078357 n=1 Tax=Hydra vulgaris TaxID=6087 RepID=A0ABM4BM91_HYDVU
MATRQITGSKELIKILSGFGHCISYSATMRYEIALASINLKEDVVLPQGTKDTSLSILVWDNIDFGEETRSGKETTHMANGITVQPLNIRPTQEKREIYHMMDLCNIKERIYVNFYEFFKNIC